MAGKKAKTPPTSPGDEVFIQSTLRRRQDIAATLRRSVSRGQANEALADIFNIDQATQLGLLRALAKQEDVDAADVLLAMHELAPQKDVRKEARRALIQLAGNKIYPSWAPGSEQPTAIADNYPPRFWKGMTTLNRESGEMHLALAWEYGFEYSEARALYFLLDFVQDGVKDFVNETGTKRTIEKHLQEQIELLKNDEDGHVEMIECTLAEGKRLLLEALDVNEWRKTQPQKDFRYFMPTINQLILNATEADETREHTFINPNLEPDEVVGNYIGAWSLGDYGLCYDLFSADSPVREGLDRDEWVERRRNWADEAHPQFFEPRVIREVKQSQAQSAIWLPGSFLSDRSATRREVDACWSLELAETPLSGTLPEMPFATAVLRETGRHWFWTHYTLVQENGAWRIQRISDEGANIQGLPLVELEKRLKEQKDTIKKITENLPDSPQPPTEEELEEIVWRTIYALHYLDTIIVKNPVDASLYADAVGASLSVGLNERCVVYLQQWAERFPQDSQYVNVLQQLGALEIGLAADYRTIGLERRAGRFFEIGEEALGKALSIRPVPINYLLMAEAKISQDEYEAAIDYLQQGLAANPTRHEEAQIENDLAGVALEQDRPAEALNHFKRVEALEPNFKNLLFNIGHTYRKLKNDAEAERYLLRAIDEDPQGLSAFIELATLYLGQNDLAKAMRVVEQGLRLHPNSPTLHALYAGMLHDQGHIRRAEAELRRAEELDPDLPIVQGVRKMFDEARR
jgi:tetratricopeptide (TPR) repeat protein